jgi:hypothetical protein
LYARGAVVTRVVSVPEALPDGPCVLEVRAGWPLFDPRSLRAHAGGTRSILAVDARPVDASSSVELGPIEQEIDRVRRALEALSERKARWAERQSGLLSVWPDPKLRARKKKEDVGARIMDGIAVSALSESLLERVHDEIASCETSEKSLRDELSALELRLAQASSSREGRDVGRSLAILVQLAPRGADEDALRSLEIEYAIDAARWWPAYKVRLSDGAKHARWSLDAYIAQSSGEDWSDVLISLSTADLVRDVRLPTLPSLRLGRAQPPKRAFRPPPQGLDELFAGYDGAQSSERSKPSKPTVPRAAPSVTEMPKGDVAGAPVDDLLVGAEGALDERTEVESDRAHTKAEDKKTKAAFTAAPMAPLMVMPAASPAPASYSMPPMQAARGGAALGRRSEESAAPSKQFATLATELDPDEQWLDYDGLTLMDPRSGSGSRGRLAKSSADSTAGVRASLAEAIERLSAPSGAVDPRSARGMFDHCYEGTSRVDVRSDGALHRVSVAQAEGHSKPKFRCVPKEAAEVYREAEVQNPFDAPLLGGPAEVFLDDALIARAEVSPGDRGSTIALGLGLEERVRVARNAKVHESSAGLLGGTTQVDHTVTIELASSLGEGVVVEVIDRVPTAKKGYEIEVAVLSTKPKAQAYTQAERGAPMDGGLKWLVDLAAGAKVTLEFAYRITFSSKFEIEGGNRRD